MKVRIHFTNGDYEDSIDIERETIEEIRAIANRELSVRGIDPYKPEHLVWSENM